MKRRKSTKSRRKATKTNILQRFTRAQMIDALGLEAEGSKRSDKYNFATANYAQKIAREHSIAAVRARKKLGLEEPS